MSTPSLLCLQWGNHKKALTCRLTNLRSEGIFCDATIVCAAKFFPVHKIVLSSCSEYFEEIFKKTPCKHPFLILKDGDVSSIEYILEFIYKGDVRIPEDRLQAFLKIAETLKVQGLAVPDVPVSEKINAHVPNDTESEDKEEPRRRPVSREGTETQFSASESTCVQNLTSVKTDLDETEISSLNKTTECQVYTGEQIYERRRSLRSRKGFKNTVEPQLASDREKSTVRETMKQPTKKSPAKVTLSQDYFIPEKENKKSKALISATETNKGAKKKVEKPDKQAAGQEALKLRECTLTFSGKPPPTEDADPATERNLSKLKGNLSQQKGSSENAVEHTISEAQMKVDVDEFFDDPNDGSRLKFTDDIVPLQYQIPDVHIGGDINSIVSEMEGPSSLATSDDDVAEEISPSADNVKMVQVSEGSSTSLQRPNGQSNSKGSAGLPASLIDTQSVEKKAEELEKPFACYICPYRTKYRSALIKHVIVHTGAKPFKCNYCPYKTSRKTHLKVHCMTHLSEKPYECEICSKTFVQKNSYKVHKLVHSNRKPFRCHLCTYATNNSASLTRHIRIHEGTIPFKCHLCSFGAQASGDLKKHLRTHTGEKPFACPHCDYKAALKTTLKRHIAARHKNS